MLLVAGCATPQWNTGFPEVHLQKPKSGALVIGVAQAEDSRASQVIGMRGRAELLAGPELGNYIERKFRNGLAERGFEPIVALDPAKSSLAQPYKIVVITLQSATFGFPSLYWGNAGTSIAIAVQVYAPPHKMIFADSYSGAHSGGLGLVVTSVRAGSVIAAAADEASRPRWQTRSWRTRSDDVRARSPRRDALGAGRSRGRMRDGRLRHQRKYSGGERSAGSEGDR